MKGIKTYNDFLGLEDIDTDIIFYNKINYCILNIITKSLFNNINLRYIFNIGINVDDYLALNLKNKEIKIL